MRAAIAETIRSIIPFDSIEQAHLASTLAWIESGAQLCRLESPATPPQHLVSYFVLVDQSRHSMLLVDHQKAGLWLPGGGHVEPDEHPRDTAVRELREELHIEAIFLSQTPIFLTVTETVGSTAGHVDVSLWYVLSGDSTRPLQYDHEEFHQIAWFSLDALPYPRTDPHLARFAAKWRTYAETDCT